MCREEFRGGVINGAFFNVGSYRLCLDGEDGYCPGVV